MSMSKFIRFVSAAVVAVMVSVAVHNTAQAAGEFDGSTFKCLDYTNGLGDNASSKMQSVLAHLWMQGYLAGYAKGKGTFELSDKKADEERVASLLLQRCRDFPGSSILAVALQAVAQDVNKVPTKTIADFSLSTYTCGQQLDARSSGAGDANKADLAELWAYAFIQGYKYVAAPDMVIAVENKPVLVGAIARGCAKNREMTYLDMTAAVADKVKLQ